MIDLGEIPEAVQWHEGMLLAPQHFQQAWRRAEGLLGYALGAAVPFSWGVLRLSLDRALLAGGRLRVLDLEAILPDGLAVRHPREGDSLLELDLAPYKDDLTQQSMAVHLAVPAEGGQPEAGEARRWRSVEGRPVADANTGDGDLLIPRLRPALTLVLTAAPTVPPQRKYVSLPIARVAFRDDAFTLDPYAPPRLDIAPGGELADAARQVAQRLREKAAAIAERLQVMPADGSDLPRGGLMEMLRAIVAPLPRLEALLDAGRVPPFAVFLVLCDMMGGLSWLGGQPVPPQPPRYQHEDALPAFREIAQFLLRMLDRVRETYRTIRFRRIAADRFSLALEADMLLGGTLVLGVRIAPGANPAETAEWMGRALIGSRSAIRAIGERRIRGAARERIEQAQELGIVPPASMVLFRVSGEAEFVVPGEVLEVVGTGSSGLPPAEIQVFAPLRVGETAAAEGATPNVTLKGWR